MNTTELTIIAAPLVVLYILYIMYTIYRDSKVYDRVYGEFLINPLNYNNNKPWRIGKAKYVAISKRNNKVQLYSEKKTNLHEFVNLVHKKYIQHPENRDLTKKIILNLIIYCVVFV